MGKLDILFLTDLHYIGKADHTCSIAIRKTGLAPALLQKVFQRVPADAYDVIVLGGDLTDNGNAEGAVDDLLELKRIIKAQDKSVMVIRGNHDAPEDLFQAVFEKETWHMTAEGYHLLAFSDRYQPGVAGQRDWQDMESLFATLRPDLPVVVFQHSPVYPPIEDEYPYNLMETERLMEFYENNRVLLSVSGHLHRGMPPVQCGGVTYVTGAALCEAPYSYALIHLEDGAVTWEQHGIEE